MYFYPSAGGRVKRLHRGALWCAFSRKTWWNCYIFARVCFLIYDILEYVYHSACDKKFSVQLDLYLLQRRYISRIFVSELITTLYLNNHHTEFVAIQSRARINLDGHSNCITDTACQLVAQNSRVVTCVQIFCAWKLGDFMNRLD